MSQISRAGRQPQPVLIHPGFVTDTRLSRAAKGLFIELLIAPENAEAPEGDDVEALCLELLVAGYIRYGGDMDTPPDKLTLDIYPYGDSGFDLSSMP